MMLHASDQSDLGPLAATRAGVYDLLAGLYLQPPSPALISALLGLAASPAMDDLSTGAAGKLLRQYASTYDGDADGVQQDFNDLFVVPLGRYVTPYEAVYRDERVVREERVRGLLMGRSTLAVLRAYRDNQFVVSPECPELPDHIGVELSFMSQLCDRERREWEAANGSAVQLLLTRELSFLEEHLMRWIPELTKRIAASARTLFFQGVGHLTQEFICADAAALFGALRQPVG